MIYLIQIGFLPISIWDILDVLIVGILLFQVYRLLRGSLAIGIIIGLVLFFMLSLIVQSLGMPLLSLILNHLTSLGIIALVVLFQPEIRRFLLLLGRGLFDRRDHIVGRIFNKDFEITERKEATINSVSKALSVFAKSKTGALIVFTNAFDASFVGSNATQLNADVSTGLLENIFFKNSPLHDGAVIISGNKIKAASCVLPLSTNPAIPKNYGLRHRSAIGATENSNDIAFIVSEETGIITYAENGKIKRLDSMKEGEELLMDFYKNIAE